MARLRILPALVAVCLGGATAAAQGTAVPCNRDKGVEPGTSGEITAGGNLVRATTDKTSITGGLTLDVVENPTACGPGHRKTSLDLSAAYDDKRPEGKPPAITRAYEATFQQQVYLVGDRLYAAANARALHNTDLGLYLAQRYSALLGVRAGDSTASIELFAGPAFVGQHFLPDPKTSTQETSRAFGAAYIGESGHLQLARLNSVRVVILTHGFWVTAPVNGGDPNPLNARGLLSLHLPLTRRVSIVLTEIDEYLKDAPRGFEPHFFRGDASFSVALGKS